jgi:hypothetical protein
MTTDVVGNRLGSGLSNATLMKTEITEIMGCEQKGLAGGWGWCDGGGGGDGGGEGVRGQT